jgi:hypothetical protein
MLCELVSEKSLPLEKNASRPWPSIVRFAAHTNASWLRTHWTDVGDTPNTGRETMNVVAIPRCLLRTLLEQIFFYNWHLLL